MVLCWVNILFNELFAGNGGYFFDDLLFLVLGYFCIFVNKLIDFGCVFFLDLRIEIKNTIGI